MKELKFDIKKFSYVAGDDIDVSFIPMMLRRKLNDFGRAGIYTLYGAYDGGSPNLVFSSSYGDVNRVSKLINQRKEDGEVSPAGFSASVHNATVGLFSLLEGITTSYNSVSAGEKSVSAGFLESILSGESLFCYTESFGGIKSVSVLTSPNEYGKYLLCDNSEKLPAKDGFEDLVEFLDGKTDVFISDLYMVKRNEIL